MFNHVFGARSRRWKVALAGVMTLQAVVVMAAPASATAGTVLLADTFTTGSVTASQYVVGGTNFTPCLTSSGSGASTPGRCAPSIDPAGDGALRLTDTGHNEAGFLLYNNPLPTRAGLDISFNMFQYGGSGADGISLFLTDGSQSLTTSGPDGGSLGYQYNGTVLGLNHALLDVGLDAFGNYSHEWNDPSCSIQGPSLDPQEIAVRGPSGADRKSGYCLLAHPVNVTGIDKPSATTRAAAERAVRIVIDPPADANPQVRVYLDGTLETTVPEPASLASTPTFKFGWAASTGGSTDVHEINFLTVSTVLPITPELSVTATPAATITTGGTTSIVATPTVEGDGGPETQPVTLTLTAPAGTSFSGTPNGPGWSCAVPSGQTDTCTYAPGTPIIPGTTLPSVTAAITSSTSGNFTVTSAVSSTDNSATGAQLTAPTVLTVHPTAAPLTGTAVAAPTSPSAITMTPPTPTGTGPFTYTLASTPSPSDGTASIDPTTGVITFTPAAGASGIANFTYTVTDADGVSSQPGAVLVDTQPVAPPRVAITDYQTAVTLALPSAPVGTGPFHYQLVTAPSAAEGVASINPTTGAITFTPAAGYTGTANFTYRTSDADGVASDPAPVAVTVRPATNAVTAGIQLNSSGDATGTTSEPSPSGTGPFTYALVGQPASGTATIDPTTGVITYTAATGVSGTFTAHYTVTDTSSLTSTPRAATITVLPFAPAEAGTTDSSTPIVLPAPAAQGTGPFTYAIVGQPAGTTGSIDPTTGAITFDPNGQSGTFDYSYTATDSNGLSSGPVAVHVDVAPIADLVGATSVASATNPTPACLTPTPVGTGPFTIAITTPLDPALGTATVVGDHIVITPAAGVSGPLSVGYTVTGADGTVSIPSSATLIVSPIDTVGQVTNLSGSTSTGQLPTPVGTGPFTYNLLDQLVPGDGTVTVDPLTGQVTTTSDPLFSGVATLHYTVTDASGLTSAPVELDVTVLPAALDFALPTSVAPVGSPPATVSAPAPTPIGTGPFSYQLVGPVDPARGTATIDPNTGVISFTPAPGTTGTTAISYTVTDGHGLVSAPAVATVVVAPAPPSGTGDATVTGPTDPGATAPVAPPAPTSAPQPTSVPALLAFTGFDPALELAFVAMLTAAGAGLIGSERRRHRS